MSKRTNDELMALWHANGSVPKSDDARLRNLIRAYYANKEVAKIRARWAADDAAKCDCQAPPPVASGAALVSEDCPVHGQLLGAAQ